MLCFRSNPSVIVFTLSLFCLFISSTFVTFSHGASHDLQQSRISGGEFRGGEVRGGAVIRRIAAESSSNSSSSTLSLLILAAKRTHRRDPSNGFKYYTGGWNITDSHYLYSVAFSAAPPFILAAAWFIIFGFSLCFICARHCCCRSCCGRDAMDYSRACYALSLVLLVLCTIATIAGCAVSYVGEEKFEKSIINITSYVLDQADFVIGNLKNLLNSLVAAKKVVVEQISLPPKTMADIDKIAANVNSFADQFHGVSENSTQEIRSFLKPIRLSLIYVAAALLIVALIGFLCSILGLKCLLYCLIMIGWILVTGTFILSGMFLLVHNAVEDTCVAMDEWLQNPNADSALENILPKVDNETAQNIFKVTKGVTFGLVGVVDGAIANVSNANNIPPNAGPLYFNQSGPPMPLLCNPYNPDLTDRQCVAGEVDLKNASEVWKNYVCQVSASGICTTPGRLTPKGYNDTMASVNVTFVLYKESPFMVDLIDSTFISETFANISKNNCPGLSRYSKWTYSGFLTASCAVTLSLVLWIVHEREGRLRRGIGAP